MTEPEQWAVELFRRAVEAYGGESIPGETECYAARVIQTAFEESERKLREENQRLMIAAAATIQGGMDEYKRGNADGVKAGIESGLEQAARIARAAQYSKSPATDTLARMEWRDIESAPKDGSWFTAYWPVQTFEDRVQTTRWLHDDCRFVDASDFMDHIQPIAWMPLPPAPEAGQ